MYTPLSGLERVHEKNNLKSEWINKQEKHVGGILLWEGINNSKDIDSGMK